MNECEVDEEFISEPIIPAAAAFNTARMSIGEPGLPGEFTWHDKTCTVKKVLSAWRKTSPCTHGRGEAVSPRWWLLSRERDTR